MVHVGWGLLAVFILGESCPVNHIQVVHIVIQVVPKANQVVQYHLKTAYREHW